MGGWREGGEGWRERGCSTEEDLKKVAWEGDNLHTTYIHIWTLQLLDWIGLGANTVKIVFSLNVSSHDYCFFHNMFTFDVYIWHTRCSRGCHTNSFVINSLRHLLSHPLRKYLQNTFSPKPRTLKFWTNAYFPILVTCCVSRVICHMSCVTSHLSSHVSYVDFKVWCDKFSQIAKIMCFFAR